MVIRRSFINYIVPLFFALSFLIAGSGILSLVVVIWCIIDWRTVYLEIDNGVIKGKKGVIFKKTMTSPIKNICYCDLRQFLIFNKAKINVATGTYIFKNMKGAKEFIEEINKLTTL